MKFSIRALATMYGIVSILSFVQQSRSSFDSYDFKIYKWAGSNLNVFIRWRLEAVVGANFMLAPT